MAIDTYLGLKRWIVFDLIFLNYLCNVRHTGYLCLKSIVIEGKPLDLVKRACVFGSRPDSPSPAPRLAVFLFSFQTAQSEENMLACDSYQLVWVLFSDAT